MPALGALAPCLAAAAPRLPPFSWDTLPVAWHSAKDTAFNASELRVLARYAAVTLEKTYDCNTMPYHDLSGGLVCQDGADLSKCGCCEEDHIVEAGRALKAINPNMQVIAYTNSVIAYPWYRGAHEFNKYPDYWLRDVNGKLLNNIKENPTETWHTWNHGMQPVNKIWQDQCLSMVETGAIDGCFVDGCTRIPKPLDTATLANYTRNKPAMLAALQAQLPGVLICGSNGAFYDGMLGTQLQNWGSRGGNFSTREIPALQRAVAAGVMFQAHGNIGQVCRNGGDPDNADVQTELAAFLVAAGPHSYYMCGDFKTARPVWLPVYDKKLGAPLGNATLEDGVYRRSFASGTVVQYDTRAEKGTIRWAA